jgi:hypothetical protein
MGKMRRQFTLTPVGKPIISAKVGWLNSELLKIRVAHGYCSRHDAPRTCPLRQHLRDLRQLRHRPRIHHAISNQLTDVQNLHADAQTRGWDSEAARVADSLTDHLA